MTWVKNAAVVFQPLNFWRKFSEDETPIFQNDNIDRIEEGEEKFT